MLLKLNLTLNEGRFNIKIERFFRCKVEVVNKGRPTSDLKNLFQTTGRKKVSWSFQREQCKGKEWFCSCMPLVCNKR